jgi:hypothetical protein
MSLDNTISEIYNEGCKEGYNENNKDTKKREYHAGYKQGYRDACDDRYWYGWYSGLMMGALVSFGGVLMYATTKKSRLTLF